MISPYPHVVVCQILFSSDCSDGLAREPQVMDGGNFDLQQMYVYRPGWVQNQTPIECTNVAQVQMRNAGLLRVASSSTSKNNDNGACNAKALGRLVF